MKNQTEQNLEVEKLKALIREIDFCMLTTVDDQGDLRSRPMSTNGEIDSENNIWFFTYGSTHKVEEINTDSKVNVSFADVENQSYVSVSGTATVSKDKRKMRELWKPTLKAWFPKGLEEPDIALLKVSIEKAEYWDDRSSTISHVFSFVSSLVTGQPASTGDHAKLSF